jgi:hypothetical protein
MRKWFGLLTATVAFSLVATTAFATTIHVYPPTTTRYTNSVNTAIKVKSHVTPRFKSLTDKHIYYYVDRKNPDGHYVFKTKVEGELYKSSSFMHRTLAKGSVTLDQTGKYRIRAKFTWLDSDGKLRVKKSAAYRYIKVVDLDFEAANYISPPTTAHYAYDKGDTVKIRSYVTPKFHTLEHKHVYYYIDRKNSDSHYVLKTKVEATLYKSDSYSHSTRVKADVKLEDSGKYRIRTKFTWTDSGGKLHVKKSTYHYIKVNS